MQQFNNLATAAKAILFLTVLLALPTMYVLANPRGLENPIGAPIDGGISLLVAAGVGYGAKKVRDARKKAANVVKNEADGDGIEKN